MHRNTLITDPRLTALGVLHGTTLRRHGDMKVPAERELFLKEQNIPSERILLLHQVHSTIAPEIFTQSDFDRYNRRPRHSADGWILGGDITGVGAAVYSADCAPVFMWDKKADMVAVLHCGWRGTVAGFAGIAARRMKDLGAKGPISAFIAAHIEPCCFEIGPEVAAKFNPASLTEKKGTIYANITHELTLQLEAAGLNRADIAAHGECTRCSNDKYHSFRRTGKTSAMLSYILL